MSRPDPSAIVDAQIDAYVKGDVAAFVACYAPDAVCTRLPGGQVIASGHDEIASVYGRLFSAPERRIRFELTARICLGDFVTDHERIIRERDGWTAEAIALYEVRDGLITRVWLVEPGASGG